jgi:hypothetical protein
MAGLAPGLIVLPLVDGDPHSAEGRLEGNCIPYLRVERIQ